MGRQSSSQRELCFISGKCKTGLTRLVRTLTYLSLGSNLGDRRVNLRDAIARLESYGDIASVSSFYETEPVGVTEQPWFLNCAVGLETERTHQQLMSAALGIEREMGRHRTQTKGPRTIDIDILLFGNTVLSSPELTIPHPAMRERRFVLEPLSEIAPDTWHPVFQRTIRELRDELPPGQDVQKLEKK